jgi:Protein of unknown function (DUF1475)
MNGRTALKLLFGSILVVMLIVTVQASLQQSVLDWGGLVNEPDRWWTIATLADAYSGFLTFYAWVFYKERGAASRLGWFVAIMLLGNFAMATYVLLQLARLPADQPLERMLLRAPFPSR